MGANHISWPFKGQLWVPTWVVVVVVVGGGGGGAWRRTSSANEAKEEHVDDVGGSRDIRSLLSNTQNSRSVHGWGFDSLGHPTMMAEAEAQPHQPRGLRTKRKIASLVVAAVVVAVVVVAVVVAVLLVVLMLELRHRGRRASSRKQLHGCAAHRHWTSRSVSACRYRLRGRTASKPGPPGRCHSFQLVSDEGSPADPTGRGRLSRGREGTTTDHETFTE